MEKWTIMNREFNGKTLVENLTDRDLANFLDFLSRVIGTARFEAIVELYCKKAALLFVPVGYSVEDSLDIITAAFEKYAADHQHEAPTDMHQLRSYIEEIIG